LEGGIEGMSILEGKGISKFFKGLTALHEVEFSVEEEEITGLIGPNGAGKTTLFNVISGEFPPSKGAIIFDSQDITRISADRICRMGIARTYQLVRPFLGLTVLKNVLIGIYFGRKEKVSKSRAQDEARELLDFMALSDKMNFKAIQLTTVERKRLEIARALATNPRILLLDEVVAGLNPTETAGIMESIQEIRRRGVTIFMIEHVMKAVMGLSDRVFVLHHGIKIAEGTPESVSVDPAVVKAYLGEKKKDQTRKSNDEGLDA
jgi:branched-chain amino acid transport system ATP-binding protein